MVGLEAKPPMGDGQPNPAVTFGYKRQEIVLIPVCPVDPYETLKFEPNATKKSDKPKCVVPPPAKQEEQVKPEPGIGSQNKQLGGLQQGSSTPLNVGNENDASDDKHTLMVSSGSSIKDEHKHNRLRRQDSYSTLGLFRMGLSWFGPAKIEQFVATGQAAVAIQRAQKNVPGRNADVDIPCEKEEEQTGREVCNAKGNAVQGRRDPQTILDPSGQGSIAPAPPTPVGP
jgi:hypothetical protein